MSKNFNSMAVFEEAVVNREPGLIMKSECENAFVCFGSEDQS